MDMEVSTAESSEKTIPVRVHVRGSNYVDLATDFHEVASWEIDSDCTLSLYGPEGEQIASFALGIWTWVEKLYLTATKESIVHE